MLGFIFAGKQKFPISHLLKVNETYLRECEKDYPSIRTLVLEIDGVKYLVNTGGEGVNPDFLTLLKHGKRFKVEYSPKYLNHERFN